MNLETVSRAPGFACGILGPLFITVWDTHATTDKADTAAAALNLAAKREEGVYVLSVLGPNTPPPDPNVRGIITAAFDRLGPRITAVANVIEGEGFRAATLRGVLIGMGMVIRRNRPERVFSSIEDATIFLGDQSSQRLRPSEILLAIKEMRGA